MIITIIKNLKMILSNYYQFEMKKMYHKCSKSSHSKLNVVYIVDQDYDVHCVSIQKSVMDIFNLL